ncbi:MAG: hypothetical protein AAF633_19195 [Chloroflexota bacterium]
MALCLPFTNPIPYWLWSAYATSSNTHIDTNAHCDTDIYFNPNPDVNKYGDTNSLANFYRYPGTNEYAHLNAGSNEHLGTNC